MDLVTGSDGALKGGEGWHSSASSTTASSPPPQLASQDSTRPSTSDSLVSKAGSDGLVPGERAARVPVAAAGGVVAIGVDELSPPRGEARKRLGDCGPSRERGEAPGLHADDGPEEAGRER